MDARRAPDPDVRPTLPRVSDTAGRPTGAVERAGLGWIGRAQGAPYFVEEGGRP